MGPALPFVGPALAVVGAVSGFLGSDDENQAQAAAFQQQAAQAALQKEAAAWQAKQDIVDLKRAAYKTLGNIRASYASSGVTVDGSPMDVLEASANLAQLDVDRRTKLGTFQEKGFVAAGQMASALAADQRSAGTFNKASSFLSGASDIFDSLSANKFLGGSSSGDIFGAGGEA